MKLKSLLAFPVIAIAALAAVVGCGYESVDNDVICQPKKVFHQTPIICPNRTDVDVSLGVMQNGVGSMSHEDMVLNVPDKELLNKLETAISSGKLVKIRYNVHRFVFCQPDHEVTSVDVISSNN